MSMSSGSFGTVITQMDANGTLIISVNGRQVKSIKGPIHSMVTSDDAIYVNNQKIDLNENDSSPRRQPLKVEVVVQGNVKDVTTKSGNVNIVGTVEHVEATSGCVTIKGNVNGTVRCTSGTIDIEGNVSGDVKCTSGVISHK